MAQFLHITDERLAHRVAADGLKPGPYRQEKKKFVYAVPVLPDFMVTHQWVRELKRRGIRSMIGVQFRIPDDEPVRVGRYGLEPMATTAAGATRIFQEHESGLGLEVTIARRIKASEIIRIYEAPQVGWRYYPTAKGKKPCSCPACSRGDINSARLRAREARAALKAAKA